jgi:hypothetical protein
MNEKIDTAGNGIRALAGFMAEMDKRGEALKRIIGICQDGDESGADRLDLIDEVARDAMGLTE